MAVVPEIGIDEILIEGGEPAGIGTFVQPGTGLPFESSNVKVAAPYCAPVNPGSDTVPQVVASPAVFPSQ